MVKFGGMGSTSSRGPSLRGRARRIRNTDFEKLADAPEDNSLSETERRLEAGRRRRDARRAEGSRSASKKSAPNPLFQLLDMAALFVLGTALLALVVLTVMVFLR